jgi:DNA primase
MVSEAHPSAGINIDFVPEDSIEHIQVFNCFSCGCSGTIPWFLYQALPDDFKSLNQAITFLESRYNVKIQSSYIEKGTRIKRYEDFLNIEEQRFEQPLTKIAPFKSGKETYQYFFDRGFTKETVKKFMIGRDLKHETITVPVFWEDNKLCGVIGRYIDPDVSPDQRFKIYDFPKGDIVFPLNHFVPNSKGEIVLVEGLFDAVYMHQLGYANTLTTFTNSVTKKQKKLLLDRGDSFIDLLDNDERGRAGIDRFKKRFKGQARIKSVTFPSVGKDPCDWSPYEIEETLNSVSRKSIKRL